MIELKSLVGDFIMEVTNNTKKSRKFVTTMSALVKIVQSV